MKTRKKFSKFGKRSGIFLIVNIIVSVFAFAAFVGLNTEKVNAVKCFEDAGCPGPNGINVGYGEEIPTNAAGGVAALAAAAKSGGATPIPTGTSELKVATTPFLSSDSPVHAQGINLCGNEQWVNGLCGSRITDLCGKFWSAGTLCPTDIAQKAGEYSYNVPFTGQTITGSLGHIVQGFFWAAALYLGIKTLGSFFGVDKKTVDAASNAAIVGVIAWKGLDLLNGQMVNGEFVSGKLLGISSGWVGLIAGAAWFALTYKKQETKIVQFTCLPWQAPIGGNNCEQCNKKDLPCSEYQCKSLGQACDIVNKGTKEEKCVWVNRQDVNPPTIEPLESALQKNFKYSPDNTISPPDRGVKILNLNSTDNCVPAFTPLTFGVKLNEPAACKVDVLRKDNFGNMSAFMSDGLLRYNHTFALSLPGPDALAAENITVQNNGNYNLFVRCRDANGNSNVATFVFKYCVDKGPDTTPPLIVTTNLLNNMPVSYNTTSINTDLYVNEPSACKWSHDDRDYNSMENNMTCATSVFEYNAQMLYKCSTTLTGLKSQTKNDFYFRCKDKPNSPESERNVNSQSYKFSLIGTQPLVIDSVNPKNQTIKDSTSNVKVTLSANTSAGYDKGNALCYYSNTGNENSYIKFFKTNSYTHSQDLFLPAGGYQYFIKCTDLGGNSDYENVTFKVETDLTAPLVVRTYKEENNLKLTTNEQGNCVYSTFGCSYAFNEGTNITAINGTSHYTSWNLQTNFYVKCRDKYGNQPSPDKCSIVVKPSKLL